MKHILPLVIVLLSTTAPRAAESAAQQESALLEEKYATCLGTLDTNKACLVAGDLYVAAWERAPTDALLERALTIYRRICSQQRGTEETMPRWAEPLPDPSCAKAIAFAKRGAAAGSLASTYARAELDMEIRDYVSAQKWLRLAAELGHARAALWLGDMLYKGEDVPVDIDAGMVWYQRAANLGDPLANDRLAGHWEVVGIKSFERSTLELALTHQKRLKPDSAPSEFVAGMKLAYLDVRADNAALQGHAPIEFTALFCAPGVQLRNSRNWDVYLLPRPEDAQERVENLPHIAAGEADEAGCIKLDNVIQQKLSAVFQQGKTPLLGLAGHYFALKPGGKEGEARSLMALRMFR